MFSYVFGYFLPTTLPLLASNFIIDAHVEH